MSFVEDYENTCKQLVLKYIEDGTRFGSQDVDILKVQPGFAYILMNATYSLKVSTYEYTEAGASSPGVDDEDVGSRALFDRVVDEILDEYLVDSYRYTKLKTELEQKGYFAYLHGATAWLDSSDRRAHYEHNCDTCHGYRQLTCHGCNGSCEVYCGCNSGHVACGFCNGSGRVMDMQYTTDHDGHTHAHTVWNSCSFCFGNGRQTCGTCGGRGLLACGTCGGTGTFTCGTCHGAGLQTITGGARTQLTASFRHTIGEHAPDWIKKYNEGVPGWVADHITPHIGKASITSLGPLDTYSIKLDPASSEARAGFKCTMAFAVVTVKLGAAEYQIRLVGTKPVITDAGAIFQSMLQGDLDAVWALSKQSPLKANLHSEAEAVIKPFAESEINQKLIEQLRRGLTKPALVNKLDSTVTEDYVTRASDSLCLILKRAANWSRAKWLAATVLLAYPWLFSMLWLWERMRTHTVPHDVTRIELLAANNFSDLLFMVICLVAFAWPMGKLAGEISTQWIHRAGHQRLLDLATRNETRLGVGFCKCTTSLALFTGISLVAVNPLWIDQQGLLQGEYVAGFVAPEVLVLPEPVQAVEKQKKPVQKRVKHKASTES